MQRDDHGVGLHHLRLVLPFLRALAHRLLGLLPHPHRRPRPPVEQAQPPRHRLESSVDGGQSRGDPGLGDRRQLRHAAGERPGGRQPHLPLRAEQVRLRGRDGLRDAALPLPLHLPAAAVGLLPGVQRQRGAPRLRRRRGPRAAVHRGERPPPLGPQGKVGRGRGRK